MNQDKIQSCIDACLKCALACENCATACLNEKDVNMMAKCILIDRDCADICITVARFLARNSKHGQHLMAECAEICNACAIECEKYTQMDHCKDCAAACSVCAEVCKSFKY